VNRKGEIRFGMAGIRNVGESAVTNIIAERTANGPFEDIFDLTRRVTSHTVNKRCLEALAQAGAFDCFAGSHRAQYFFKEREDDSTFLEKVMRQAADFLQRKNSSQHSLFGETEEVAFKPPALPQCEPWSRIVQLKTEKEVTGFYISGHPLDDYKVEFENFCTVNAEALRSELKRYRNLDISFAGMVTNAQHKTGKNGKPFGAFTVEDYLDSINLFLYSEEYFKYKHLIEDGMFVFIKARVEGRFDAPDQLVIRVSAMVLLSEVLEKFTKSVAITMPLAELRSDRITHMLELAKKHKGKAALRIRIEDTEERTSIDLPSKKYRVNPREIVRALTEFPDLEVKLLHD
jgi:DNA polymerase III subunit alpha